MKPKSKDIIRGQLAALRRISGAEGWAVGEKEREGHFRLHYIHFPAGLRTIGKGTKLPKLGKVFAHSEWMAAADMVDYLRAFTVRYRKSVPPSEGEGCEHNDAKASFAAATLAYYETIVGKNDGQTTVTDLLGDLAHYCDRHGLDFPEARLSADCHYGAETKGQGSQFDAELSVEEEDAK